jgi:tRNA (pseudouridine54-N1)-methyltransferase
LEELERLRAAQEVLGNADTIYIVISPTARTKGDFPSRGYAGHSGRLDVVARAAASALYFDEKTAFVAVLLGPPEPPKTLVITRRCLSASELGERTIMNLFRRLLKRGSHRGCLALDLGISEVLYIISKLEFETIYLHEGGDDVEEVIDVVIRGRKAFVLGSHVDIPKDYEIIVRKYAMRTVSVGPKSLLTSHVILYLSLIRTLKRATCYSEQP